MMPAHTFVATAVAARECGYDPFLADVDADTWMLDPQGLLGHPLLDRIGVVGFCAGGGNAWDLAVYLDELAGVVVFYGAPAPPIADIVKIQPPLLLNYGERDRALTTGMAPVMVELLARQKVFGFNVYEGAAHAFHNDTGANYNAEAACDAWAKTITFFNKWLKRP